MPIECTVRVNGVDRTTSVGTNELLADWLRDGLALRGTRVSCDAGSCGVCTVLVDDQPYASCSTFVYEVDGCRVETVEGLVDSDGRLHPVQRAFLENFGFQCGFCTPGMVLSTVALLRANAQPTEAEIREWLAANVCRCTGYQAIIRSVKAAVQLLDEESP